jgi:AcrR family transcriptional regulator
MIRYYFGNKEGLYEEMIRETLKPLLDVLDGRMLSEIGGFSDFLRLYYDTMSKHPEFPKLILKVLALNQGPGRRFVLQLLERGRTRGAHKVEELKASGMIDDAVDPDIVRLAFVSLAMTPMLLKGIFEEQIGKPWQHLTRFEQIARHVTRNKVVDWIAVDNDSKGWPNNQRHRLVLTQDDIGLGEEAAQQELANALLRLKQNEL